MKILPISNGHNNVSLKGSLTANTQLYLLDFYSQFEKGAKRVQNDSAAKSLFEKFAQRTNNVMKNLETTMLRFPKSSYLHFETSPKTGKKRFYIHSYMSDYKYLVGDLEPKDNIKDLEKLEGLADKLAEANHYEINLKFKTHRTLATMDENFAPEKDILFLEDELIGKELRK